jgi:hypothetical protein
MAASSLAHSAAVQPTAPAPLSSTVLHHSAEAVAGSSSKGVLLGRSRQQRAASRSQGHGV